MRHDPFDELVADVRALIATADLLGTNLTGSVTRLRAALQRYEAYREQCLKELTQEDRP